MARGSGSSSSTVASACRRSGSSSWASRSGPWCRGTTARDCAIARRRAWRARRRSVQAKAIARRAASRESRRRSDAWQAEASSRATEGSVGARTAQGEQGASSDRGGQKGPPDFLGALGGLLRPPGIVGVWRPLSTCAGEVLTVDSDAGRRRGYGRDSISVATASVSRLDWRRRAAPRALVLVAVGVAGIVATALTAWAVANSPILVDREVGFDLASPGRRGICGGGAV